MQLRMVKMETLIRARSASGCPHEYRLAVGRRSLLFLRESGRRRRMCRRGQFRGVDGPIEWERAIMPGALFRHHFAVSDERYFGDRLRFAVTSEMAGAEINHLLPNVQAGQQPA